MAGTKGLDSQNIRQLYWTIPEVGTMLVSMEDLIMKTKNESEQDILKRKYGKVYDQLIKMTTLLRSRRGEREYAPGNTPSNIIHNTIEWEIDQLRGAPKIPELLKWIEQYYNSLDTTQELIAFKRLLDRQWEEQLTESMGSSKILWDHLTE